MADDVIQAELERHSRAIDETVLVFLRELDRVIAIAQATLQQRLLMLLKLDAGAKIVASAGNQKILRRLPLLWQNAIDEAGLEHVVDQYMASFPRQVPAFMQVLQAVNHEAKNPLPLPDFTKADHSYFNALKLSAGADVSGIVEGAVAAARTRVIFTTGGLGFKELVKTLMDTTPATLARAETIANTSLMGLYRVVAQTGYEKIETKIKKPLLYDYLGPDDLKTRPKCHEWVNRSKRKPFTKDEVDHLNNGTSFMPVWVFGGGPNCRHSINLSTRMKLAQGVETS